MYVSLVVARMYREYTSLFCEGTKGIESCINVVVSMYVSQKETVSNQFTDFDSTKRDKYSLRCLGRFDFIYGCFILLT